MEKPFEMIKAVDAIKEYVSPETYQKILLECELKEDECQRRMKGIKKEAEFILALHMLGCCNKISPIDEKFSNTLDTYSSDVLINLKNGKTIFLEIKCEFEKDKYKITKNNLKKRIDYAKAHSFDLLFAINIKGLWMLFDSSYLLEKNCKITFEDYNYSILGSFFGFNNYMVKNFESKEVYSKREKNVIGVVDENYGNLVSQEIIVNNKRIFKIKKKDNKYYMYLFAYEALLERAVVYHQEENGFDIVTRKIEGDGHIINEIELLLAPISHLEKGPGIKYDAESYLRHLSDLSKKCPLNIQHIRIAMNEIGAKILTLVPKQGE